MSFIIIGYLLAIRVLAVFALSLGTTSQLQEFGTGMCTGSSFPIQSRMTVFAGTKSYTDKPITADIHMGSLSPMTTHILLFIACVLIWQPCALSETDDAQINA